jgi:branched-chain amino acid transport system ATP-binding protein
MTLLSVEGVEARYDLLSAVRDVSLSVAQGEVVALVGANGAGKTTLLRTIAGAHKARRGRVMFDATDVTVLPPHRRVELGIALVPEGRRLFSEMSVRDNLRVAAQVSRPGSWTLDAVAETFPFLKSRWHARAGHLSGGQQQAVAIGRALLANPRLLMLDEVSLGLSPLAVRQLYESMAGLMSSGVAILLVEQDLKRALQVAHRVVCLLEGQVVLQKSTRDVSRAEIVEAYFGLGKAGRDKRQEIPA